jgi:hypothetical protein
VALPCSAASIYDFSGLTPGTVPAAAETPPPAGTSWQGSYTYDATPANIGGINVQGQDKWVWASSTANIFSSIARNDAQLGMSGTYISAYPTVATSATGAAPLSYDTINSRVNTGGATFGIPNGAKFRVGFTANISAINYTNASGAAQTNSSRAEMALGYDQNGDGDIRGDSMNLENMEWGPMFGYEPAAGAGAAGLTGRFYLRPASLGTAVTANANGPGVYRFELEIDPNANPVAATANNFAGNNGKGTLYVQQLFDGAGLPVVDSLHSITGLIDIDLGLTRMTQHNSTNVGTVNGWNPAFWNGFFTRLSNNGMMDDVTLTVVPEPTTLASLGIAGAALLRRRKPVA